MRIDRITNSTSFKSLPDKQKRQEYLRDAADVCIAVGFLTCDSFLSSNKKKTKLQNFGEIAFIIGAGIITWRICDKLLNLDKHIEKEE